MFKATCAPLIDSADWNNERIEQLDMHLRCPICKDYFKTATVLLPCSHNFCALCIRECFSLQSAAKNQCPVCRCSIEPCTQMRVNKCLDEIVESFHKCTPLLLSVFQSPSLLCVTNSNSNGRQCDAMTQTVNAEDELKTERVLRKRKRMTYNNDYVNIENDVSESDSHAHPTVMNGNEGDSVIIVKFNDQLKHTRYNTSNSITCPCCSKRFKCSEEEFSSFHLDMCLQKSNSTSVVVAASETSDIPLAIMSTKSKKEVIKRKHLPKLWYSGMTVSKLRHEMAKLNLPTSGDFKTLKNRHRQYVNIWNGACDDDNCTLSDKDLIQQLIDWELSTKQETSSQLKKLNIDTHLNKYEDEFRKLIQSVRNRKSYAASNVTSHNDIK